MNDVSSLSFICPKCNRSFDKEYKLNAHIFNFDHTRNRTCLCGCGEQVEIERSNSWAKYRLGHIPEKVKHEVRLCDCKCGETFKCRVTSTQRFIDNNHYLAYRKLKEEIICPKCNRVCLNENGLITHLQYCQTGKVNKRKLPKEIRTCECGCGETFECGGDGKRKRRRFIEGHYEAWNSGLTKETDSRLEHGPGTYKPLICKGCGLLFTPHGSKQEFCLVSCRNNYNAEYPESNGRNCIACSKQLLGYKVKYCDDICKDNYLREIRTCLCGCKGEFKCRKKSKQEYIVGHGLLNPAKVNTGRWVEGSIPVNKGKTMVEIMGEARYIIYLEKQIINRNNEKQTDRYIRGKYSSKKNLVTFEFDSGWELTTFINLENDLNVLEYERCQFSIPYIFEGITHRYFPDLLVKYTDGSDSIIEVKADNMLDDPKTIEKFKIGRKYCKKNKMKYVIKTEKDIKIIGYANLDDIVFYREDKKKSYIKEHKRSFLNVIK